MNPHNHQQESPNPPTNEPLPIEQEPSFDDHLGLPLGSRLKPIQDILINRLR